MAASQVTIATAVLNVRNQDQLGKNLVMEFHEIKFDSDATVEVDTGLSHIISVLSGPTKDVSAPTANVLGCDMEISAGKVTVGATASNSDYFFVCFIGYI